MNDNFKQHIYESIMSRLSDIVTIRLNEKFGIYDYDNELLDSECSEISKNIVRKFVADIPNKQKNCRLITYFDSVKLQRCLSVWSETFGTYFVLYQFFKLAKKCLPDEIKMKFVNNDVKLVYGHKRDNFKFKYPYTNDFSDNGIYNLKSFDNFVDFHMNRIYENFLKKALSMTIDYIGLNNDDKLHLKTLSHSNSSNQNKYNK